MKNPTDVGQSALTLALLGDDRRSRWARRVALGMSAYQLGKSVYSWVESKKDQEKFKVSVPDHDSLYDLMQTWFVDQLPPNQRRAIVARTEYRRGKNGISDANITFHIDDGAWQDVKIDGHKIRVSVEEVDPKKTTSDDFATPSGGGLRRRRLVFASATQDGRDAVVRLLEEFLTQLHRQDHSSDVFMLNAWGDWVRISGLQARTLDSVILADSTLEDLVADLQHFYDNERRYVELGLPWHRGYLLHGPPGTGKTSTARVVAGVLDLDVYYVPLKDVNRDTDLARVLSSIDEKSVLLLEDVDIVHATRERDDSQKGITMSGLLNALDGVVTPHGMVTFMTTNRLDVLDEAFLRPGRADRLISIGYLQDEQLRRLVKYFLERDLVDVPSVEGLELTPSDVLEVIKQHLDDSDAAYRAVVHWLRDEATILTTADRLDGDGVRM